MAIDTSKKRKSAYFQLLPWLYRIHDVDNSIDSRDRENVALIYSGISPLALQKISADAIALTFYIDQSRGITASVNQSRSLNSYIDKGRAVTVER